MTVEMLREAGVSVTTPATGGDADTWRVAPGPVRAVDWAIEPDLSNATPFLAAAAVTGGTVSVPLWPSSTTQPGDAIRGILASMGADVTLADGVLTVRGPEKLRGIDIDLHDVGELTPTVAALAALAEGTSHLRGIAHLRGHETDRLAALADEINKLGGSVTETDDGLTIVPRGTPWRTMALVCRPPHGNSRRHHRPGRRRRRRRRCRNHRQDTARLREHVDRHAREFAGDTEGKLLSPRQYDESDVRVRPGRGSAPVRRLGPNISRPNRGWWCRRIVAVGVASSAAIPTG